MRKLRGTRDEYQQALQAAFNANCTTWFAANDGVVESDLSGYAKNALKQYVSQPCRDSYDAEELYDDHPVKCTNEGVQLDHQPQNHYGWYVKILHHEDYHLWLPAAANLEQHPWLKALHTEDAGMGECRFLEGDGG